MGGWGENRGGVALPRDSGLSAVEMQTGSNQHVWFSFRQIWNGYSWKRQGTRAKMGLSQPGSRSMAPQAEATRRRADVSGLCENRPFQKPGFPAVLIPQSKFSSMAIGKTGQIESVSFL